MIGQTRGLVPRTIAARSEIENSGNNGGKREGEKIEENVEDKEL